MLTWIYLVNTWPLVCFRILFQPQKPVTDFLGLVGLPPAAPQLLGTARSAAHVHNASRCAR